MKLQTITTIELSSICNLSCKYCVNPLMSRYGRTPAIMNDSVFDASLDVLRVLCERGTQREVNINGNGESCIDKKLPMRAAMIKGIMGSNPVQFCTNGVLMTIDLAHSLLDAGVDRIDISPHDTYHARRVHNLFVTTGIPHVINFGAIMDPHNWAGQLREADSVDNSLLPSIPCHPLIEGRGYIQDHGGMSPCCYDFRGLGQFGTVFDQDILDRETTRYSLCDTCHQTIPKAAAVHEPIRCVAGWA